MPELEILNKVLLLHDKIANHLKMPHPYKVFTIYAREDAQYLDELRGQLRPLEIAQRITVWNDQEITPGEDWEAEIVQNLNESEIILILVSSDYYNSAFIHEKEIKYALSRHENGEVIVLPIILRPCSFSDDPIISKLQVLPSDGKPVTDKRYWPERDHAWLDVVTGLKRSLDMNKAAKSGAYQKQEESEQLNVENQQQPAEYSLGSSLRSSLIKMFPKTRIRIRQLKKGKTTSFFWLNLAGYVGVTVLFLLLIWQLFGVFSERKPFTAASFQGAPADFKFDYPMEFIQGGTYKMGSLNTEKGRYEDECAHSVGVSSFSIGKFEITQTQWKSVMGKNPSNFQNCGNCPVENVSWNEVQNFIQKLNEKTGNSYRLPTEAEWEFAARGGVKSNGYVFAGGNAADLVAWNSGNSSSKTHPVGQKIPNEAGLYDMSGNVWEWCRDIYSAYPNCNGDNKGQGRVIRGGSWFLDGKSSRSAHRIALESSGKGRDVGFRLVSLPIK